MLRALRFVLFAGLAVTLAAQAFGQEPAATPVEINKKAEAPDQGAAPLAPSREFVERHPHFEKLVKILDLQFDQGELLADVLTEISEDVGVPIDVAWERLSRDEGLGKDVTLSNDLQFGRMSARNYLYHVLKPYRLTWSETRNGILVTTQVEAETRLTSRTHSVGDLLVIGRAPPISQAIHPYFDQDDAIHREIEAALQRPTTVSFKRGDLLTDVLRGTLKDLPGAVVVDWERLDQDEGIGNKVALASDVELKNVVLADALATLLKQHRLAWSVERGALLITTQVEHETQLRFYTFSGTGVLYEVRAGLLGNADLTRRDEQQANSPPDEAPAETSPTEPGRNPAKTSVVPAPVSAESDRYVLNAKSIVNMIRANTTPHDSWDDLGGPGAISVFRPTLEFCVVQTPDAARQVKELLDSLRDRPLDPAWGENARPAQPQGVDPTRPDGMGEFRALLDLIREVTTPRDVWEDQGGPATLTPLPTQMVVVVHQTDRVHEQIEELLAKLRRGRWWLEHGTKPWEHGAAATR